MKVLIIEDEPLAVNSLIRLVKGIQADIEIESEILTSVAQAKEWFTKHPHPDLIFSDIQLSDGLSFSIFENIVCDSPIVFTTAYDEYAIRAFKLNSIDYLLKPIDERDLRLALQKFSKVSTVNWSEQFKSFLEYRQQPEIRKYKTRFLAQQGQALIPVNVEQVSYFQKDQLIYLHTFDGNKLIDEHETLDELESLINPALFFRANRQFLIQKNAVNKIKTTHKGLLVELKGAIQQIEVSREKATAFKNWML
ncbi:MAG: LytR/AlgR family response regulator transcription factor [Chryseotalea sp.]|jgi:two-component system LytT family response regulator